MASTSPPFKPQTCRPRFWRTSGRIAFVLLAVSLAGCYDLKSLLREELAVESELIDRVIFIKSEADAKNFFLIYDRPFQNKLEELNKKKEESVEDLAKGPRVQWKIFQFLLDILLEETVTDETFQKIQQLGKQSPEKFMEEEFKDLNIFDLKNFAKRRGLSDKKVAQLKALLPDPNVRPGRANEAEMQLQAAVNEQERQEALARIEAEKKKAYAALPPAKFLVPYMRERLSLSIARQRELNRLGGIIKGSNEPTPELLRLVKSLQPKKAN